MTYSKDTRLLQPGEIYAAIVGERFDGHAFVEEAIAKGAAGVVIEREVAVADEDVNVIRVENTEQYLAEQAYKKLKEIGPDVVGITGSIGKTSTKNAIVTVLQQQHEVLTTEGNLNTVLGLALTILNTDFDAETKLVLEMGASHVGDIAELCRYYPPNVAVVTNVHGVHLSSFGSIENIEHTKGELVRALDGAGIACLNYDDERVRRMAASNEGRTLFYGRDARCDVRPELIEVELPLLGEHAVYTALAAFAAGRALGLSDSAINAGLSQLKPEKGRLYKLPGVAGCTLIDDTYNASPAAVRAALDVMRQQPGTRHVAFLGDMLELGETEIEEHVDIIRAALDKADEVFLVGELMNTAAATLPDAMRDRLHLHKASADLAEGISQGRLYQPATGDVVLVKGSQGARMERISKALLHPDVDPADVLPRQSASWQSI